MRHSDAQCAGAGCQKILSEREFDAPKQFVTSANAPTTGFTDLQKTPPTAQAIRFGNMLFVSGQGPLDPATKTVVEGDIEIQMRRTLDNLLSVLEAGGATPANVVNMRVILRRRRLPALQRRVPDLFRERSCHVHLDRPNAASQGVNVEIDRSWIECSLSANS